MKRKNLRLVVLLLLLVVLLTAVCVSASAADNMPFSTIQLIATTAFGNDQTQIFYPNHEAKTLILYSSKINNVVATNPRWSALDSDGNVIAGMEVTCDDFKKSSYDDVSEIKVTYQGETTTYLQYHAKEKWPMANVAYSVTDTRDNDGNLIPEEVNTSVKTAGTSKSQKKKWGSTTVTSTSDATPTKEVASNTKITLLGFAGKIDSIEPQEAVLAQTSNSVTVNWYKTTGTVTININAASLPKTSKLPGVSSVKTIPITVNDRRIVKQTVTPYTNGTIKTVYKEAYAGDTVWWTAEPDEGYKLNTFTAKDAFGKDVTCTVDPSDTNRISFMMPYGEVTVSATFAELQPGEKSSTARMKSMKLGKYEGKVSGTEVTIEGPISTDDLTQLAPSFTLSNGAYVEDADTLRFKNRQRQKVTVMAEDGVHSCDYYVTVYQVTLEGLGTAEKPFLIKDTNDFTSFVDYHPEAHYLQQADLNLSGVTAPSGAVISGTFKGVYDGGNHKITGLKLNNLSVDSNAALFHTVSGTVKNLTIESDCSFTARQWVGSFALYLKDGGKLDSCVNRASVTCKPTKDAMGGSDASLNCFAGGLVARTNSSWRSAPQNQITNCRNEGGVTVDPADVPNGSFASAGGLVGGPANVKISRSANTGAVSNAKSRPTYYGTDGNYTGGLVGQIDPNGAFGVKTEIVGCVNSGSVTGGCNVGGIAGRVNDQNGSVLIESCRNLGNVHATNTADVQNVGGILGCGYAEIYNCDSAGTITGETTSASAYRGAIAGYLRRENSVISRCFVANADSVVGGQANGVSYSGAVETKFIAASDVNSQTHIDELNAYEKPKSLLKITFRAPTAEETWAGGNYIPGEAETAKGYEAKLLGFAIDGHQAEIDEAAKTVTLVLPHGTTLTSLTPTLTRSSGATYTPTGAQDFSAPVAYTVTSEDKSATATYTVTVTAASEASGLGSFAVKQGSTAYPVTTGEDGRKTVTIPASALASNAESALTFLYRTNSGKKAEGAIGGTALTQTTSGAYDALSWPFSTATLTSGTKTLTMTFGDETQLVDIVIVPELSSLSVKIADAAQRVTKTETGYKLDLPDSASTVSVTAVPALTSDTVTISGTANTTADVDVTGKTSFDIVVSGKTLTVAINRVKTTSVTFTTTPADAAVTVIDQAGTPVLPDSKGVYTLLGGAGYTYTYRVSSSGYVTKTGSLTQVQLRGGSLLIDVSLAPAGSTVTPVDPSEPVTGEWPSFRGNEANNGVTSAKTPISKDETVKSWSVQIGGTPTPPLMVSGKLYVLTGSTVKAIDPKTGTVTATSEKLAGTSQFGTNPIAYGDGKFYIQLDANTSDEKAHVQAIDAATLKSVWVSEGFEGQLISPITYHNGYIYTGTWQQEEKTGAYFCLSTTDEDPGSTTETKYTSWRISKTGGFYWVGAYATDNYVIFGSDNGKGGSTEYGSTLYSVNAKTGAVIDTETNLIGDLRSAVVKSGSYVYFTSKAGYLYRAAVSNAGQLGTPEALKLDGMITGTPVVCGDTVFVTCSGQTQFQSPGKIYAIKADAETMSVYDRAATTGYIQSSLLVSDAYKAGEGKLYIYGSCNEENGTINFFKYDVANHTFDTGVTKELYTPTGAEKQYNLCSLICDARGTLYFKNDSGYLTALAREVIETDVSKVEDMIDALFPITDDSLTAIKQARRYYEALSDKKSEVTNLTSLERAEAEYQQRLTNKRQTALDDLKKIYDAKDTKDFTARGLQKLKEAYEEGVRNINNADDCKLVESSFNAAAEKINKLNGKDITVTFRLIGALQATQDVNLTKDSYLPEYVTWIPTTSYDLQEDATVYDLYTKAIGEAGLRSIGEENDYVRTIYAPSCLGGYALSEFTNGARSGWMYTVNGTHPDRGLKNWKLKDGDVVVWHYINDYAHEAADWFDDPDYPALGDGTYYNGWLRAADISPEQYVQQLLGKILKVGKNGTVEPKLALSHIGRSVTFTFKPDKGYHVKDVKVDGKSVGAVTTYTVDKLTVSTRIEVEFTNGVLPFTDVREADWFYDDVVYAYENGLFSGTSDTTFSPNASMTRAMLVTVLYRLEGQPTVSGRSGFSDVKLNSYYEDAVTWAADNGIVNGTGATTFSPNANVTREQMAAILYRYAQYKQYGTTASAGLNGFSDAAKVSTYAKAPLSWAVAEKLVNGSEGRLLPTGNATRAQVAAILHRFVENVAKTTA